MRRWLTGLVLCSIATLAWADEHESKRAKSWDAQLRAFAREVAERHAAGDPSVFATLAGPKPPIDPWFVADALVRLGKHEVAVALAATAKRPELERLADWIASQQGRVSDAARLARLEDALAAARRGKLDAAIEKLGEPDPAELDDVLGLRIRGNRSGLFAARHRWRAAWEGFAAAAAAAEKLGWLRYADSAYQNAGHAAWRGSLLDEGLRAWKRRIEVCRRFGNERGVAEATGYLGLIHADRGDLEAAIEAYEASLVLQRKLGNRSGKAVVLGNAANAYQALGDLTKARAAMEEALKIKREVGDRHGVYISLGNLANLHHKLGDTRKALALAKESIKGKRAVGDRVGAARVLASLGHFHQALGAHGRALSALEAALGEARAVNHQPTIALALSGLASAYATIDPEASLGHYEEALELYQALGVHDRAADVQLGLANALAILERSDEALIRYQALVSEWRQRGGARGLAAALGNMANVHAEREEHAKALALLQEALATLEAADVRPSAWLLERLGSAHHELGKPKEARAFLKQSIRAARSAHNSFRLAFALQQLARVHWTSGEPAQTLSACQRALDAMEGQLGGLSEGEGARLRAGRASVFDLGALAALSVEEPEEAFMFLESGRAGALLDAMDSAEILRWKAATLPADLRAADQDARSEELRARKAYDRAYRSRKMARIRAAEDELDKALAAVRRVNDRIQREMTQQANLFYFRPKRIDDVQRALGKHQVLVVYGLCEDEAVALVLTDDNIRVARLGSTAAVTEACASLDIAEPESAPGEGLARLRSLLVEPLKLDPRTRQVLLSPDGQLAYAPFGALFEPHVAMIPSATTWLHLRDDAGRRGEGILALGDPDYGGISDSAQKLYYRGRSLVPLPATRGEAKAFGTTTLLGDAANETALVKTLSTRERWQAIHLACHGLVDRERPMFSSLALSRTKEEDGFLTALEILRLRIPADLAVLSACETGRGEITHGEGTRGLMRAFMFAGSPRVICSLWKVDDEATRALMIRFYELWNPKDGEGLGAAEALRKAQAHVRSHERWKHPYYWAAWVLWGLPD